MGNLAGASEHWAAIYPDAEHDQVARTETFPHLSDADRALSIWQSGGVVNDVTQRVSYLSTPMGSPVTRLSTNTSHFPMHRTPKRGQHFHLALWTLPPTYEERSRS